MNEQGKQTQENDLKNKDVHTGQTDNKTTNTKSGIQQTADKASSAVNDALKGDTGAATEKAKEVYSEAKGKTKEVAGQALGTAKKQAVSKIDEQKSNLAQNIGTVAQEIRTLGDNLNKSDAESSVVSYAAQYGNTIADKVENFSQYLDDKNLSELVTDIERFAKRNPAVFIGSAFALGFLGARFLKSSTPSSIQMRQQLATGSKQNTNDDDNTFATRKPDRYPA